MGNICRSPSAEGVFAAFVRSRVPDLEIEIDSAGTHDYHVGSPPDRRTIAAAARRGKAASHESRSVRAHDAIRYPDGSDSEPRDPPF